MAINNLEPFKFWCQKVLPLVYDNSLSYYEALCKMCKKINEIIEVDNQQNEAIQTLQEDVSQLEYYLEELKGCIALEYDSNNSYSKGMYCIFNNDLYVCEESTTGEFDRNAWTHTNLGSELSDTNNDLSLLDNRVRFTEREIERINGVIDNINQSIITINSRIENIITELAPTYDASRTYSKGEYCTFLGDLYVCTASTTGEFDRACWDGTDVGFELYQLRQETERIDTTVNAFQRALENIREQLITLTNNFASEYAENTYYNVGQYCIYNDILYKCVEAIPNPSGEFDPLKWTRTKVSIELVDVQDECSNIRLALDGLVVNFMGNLALPFSNYEGTTVTYNVGDFVTDYQWLYKCIQGYTFSQVVPTPANDRVHWQQTTIADNLSSGGGGGGNVNVAPYDTTKEYVMGEFAEFAGTIYECIANSATGSFDANKWSAIEPMSQLAGLQRIDYYIDSAIDENNQLTYGEGEYAVYRNTDNVYTLLRAKVDGATDPTDIGDFERTSVIGELGDIRNTVTGFKKTTFDENKVYNKGDIVFYNGVIVECKNDGVTGEYNVRDWNYGNTIFSELAKLITTINNLNLYNGNVVDRYNTNVTEVI